MFDELFRSPAVVQRHRSSPLLQERLEYLQHCANQGYRLTTLRELAADLLLILNLLGLATSSDLLSLADVQAGVSRWVDRRPRHFKHKNGRRRSRTDSPACGKVASILGAPATSRRDASCLSFSA